jgi:hypothetical protein
MNMSTMSDIPGSLLGTHALKLDQARTRVGVSLGTLRLLATHLPGHLKLCSPGKKHDVCAKLAVSTGSSQHGEEVIPLDETHPLTYTVRS